MLSKNNENTIFEEVEKCIAAIKGIPFDEALPGFRKSFWENGDKHGIGGDEVLKNYFDNYSKKCVCLLAELFCKSNPSSIYNRNVRGCLLPQVASVLLFRCERRTRRIPTGSPRNEFASFLLMPRPYHSTLQRQRDFYRHY